MDQKMVGGYAINMWTEYKKYLDKIFQLVPNDRLTQDELNEANKIIFDVIAHSRAAGSTFYKVIYCYLVLHCTKIAVKLNGNAGNIRLITSYRSLWYSFLDQCNQFHLAASNLDEMWAKHHYAVLRLAKEPTNVYDTEQLPLVIWKKIIYDLVSEDLTELLMGEVRKLRISLPMHTGVVSEIITSYLRLGFKDGRDLHRRTSLVVYENDFEIFYLRDLEDFYKRKRIEHEQNNNLKHFKYQMKRKIKLELRRGRQILTLENNSAAKIKRILKCIRKNNTEE